MGRDGGDMAADLLPHAVDVYFVCCYRVKAMFCNGNLMSFADMKLPHNLLSLCNQIMHYSFLKFLFEPLVKFFDTISLLWLL